MKCGAPQAGSAGLLPTSTPPFYLCNDCGVLNEEDDLHRCSLDAYADLSVDYDLFCPCGSDDLTEVMDADLSTLR